MTITLSCYIDWFVGNVAGRVFYCNSDNDIYRKISELTVDQTDTVVGYCTYSYLKNATQLKIFLSCQLDIFTSILKSLRNEDQDYHNIIQSLETGIEKVRKIFYNLQIIDNHALVLDSELNDGSQRIIQNDFLHEDQRFFIIDTLDKINKQLKIYLDLMKNELEFFRRNILKETTGIIWNATKQELELLIMILYRTNTISSDKPFPKIQKDFESLFSVKLNNPFATENKHFDKDENFLVRLLNEFHGYLNGKESLKANKNVRDSNKLKH